LPHVLVGSKSFHHREEIAALRTALRAIEWREDKLSEYATLRNFYGITDGTLFQHDLCDRADTRISEARAFLQKLHYGRDKHPIADTINRLLEHCRALTAFSLRKGGRRVVANVQRLVETARTFELRYATSFRSFVEYLEEQAERGEAADAPVLEQESDGVKLMTVHKAKGLEFKVVILADLTAHLTGQGDRYVNGELCAQRLLGCAPWDLIDNIEHEAEADREEGIRVAYVAATRAKDMLVVTAVGDRGFVENHELFKTSWLAPIYPALYPHMDRWRLPERPVQGLSTVKDDPESLRPGLHRGRVGGGEVWWFDPGRLELEDSADSGLDDTSILQGDPNSGFAEYTAWQEAKQAIIDKASEPAFRLAIASEAAADRSAVEVYRTRPKLTPKGTRLFGKMVHGILQHGLESSDSQMREHGCSEEDRIAAVERVQFALGHEVMAATHIARAVYRELPVMVKFEDGSLVEGRADLAYFDGQRWTVVDFKTGEANAGDRAQVRMYAQALERATGQPVRAVILEI
jgi:ATP-dependent exoDNAse (exonuclease V) beta subunit